MPDTKPIRTQSADPVIRDAARQGVKLHKIAGGYFTLSAAEVADSIGCDVSTIRRACAIHVAGLGPSVISGELTPAQAYRLARQNADSVQDSRNQRRSIKDDLADAVQEIRRLRAKLEDLGVDPDG